jgi:hypothetical protein
MPVIKHSCGLNRYLISENVKKDQDSSALYPPVGIGHKTAGIKNKEKNTDQKKANNQSRQVKPVSREGSSNYPGDINQQQPE